MSAAAAGRPLADHSALITGSTGGIGYETARALARSGARVIITGRDPDSGERAAATIARESGRDSVTFLNADHSTVGGNQDLADRVRATAPRLNLLINNVGGLYATRWETLDGYEAALAMNVVGPYTLTAELLPLPRAAGDDGLSRCVNVVSAAFKMWTSDPFTDLQSTQRFVSGEAYAHAKLLNVLASMAWASRLLADQITVNVIHPGLSWTAMTRSMTAQMMPSWRLIWPMVRLLQHRGSPIKAGRRVDDVASSPQTVGHTGQYFERRRGPTRLSARELDPHNQGRAWELSARLMTTAPTYRQPRAGPEAG